MPHSPPLAASLGTGEGYIGPTMTLDTPSQAPVDIPTGPQRAPRGAERTCKSWGAEAAMRMLMNNLVIKIQCVNNACNRL